MNSFKLEPADILVTVNDRNDPFSRIKRWAVGPYDHIFLYLGEVRIIAKGQERLIHFPLLYESNGRGVVIQSLSNRYGQKVAVMRLKSEHDRRRIPKVLVEAVKLASDPQAYYDYYAIATSVLPRIIMEKLHLPIPVAWERDERQICSEACFEVFYRAKLVDILPPNCTPPLPGDFVTDSLLLDKVWEGILTEGNILLLPTLVSDGF